MSLGSKASRNMFMARFHGVGAGCGGRRQRCQRVTRIINAEAKERQGRGENKKGADRVSRTPRSEPRGAHHKNRCTVNVRMLLKRVYRRVYRRTHAGTRNSSTQHSCSKQETTTRHGLLLSYCTSKAAVSGDLCRAAYRARVPCAGR